MGHDEERLGQNIGTVWDARCGCGEAAMCALPACFVCVLAPEAAQFHYSVCCLLVMTRGRSGGKRVAVLFAFLWGL